MALKAEYAFSVGDAANDAVGSADLTLTGSPDVAGGKNGGGILLDPTRLASTSGIAGVTGASTVMFWVKLSATSGFAGNVVKNGVWSAYVNAFGASPKIEVYNYGDTGLSVEATLPVDTNWHHFAATFTTGGNIVVYLDGALQSSDVIASPQPNWSDPFTLGGSDPDGLGGGGTLTVDEFRIFDETLANAAAVTTWMNTVAPSVVPPPLGDPKTSMADLETVYLRGVSGNTDQRLSLSGLRRLVYGVDEWAYFSGLSGLVPAGRFTLADHMLAYYRTQGGIAAGTLADAQRAFWS